MTKILPLEDEPVDDLEDGARVADRDGVGELPLDLRSRRAEQRGDDRVVDVRAARDDHRLVEQGEGVAERALGLARDRRRGRRRQLDALVLRDVL